MPNIYTNSLYCSAINQDVDIQYTENLIKTQPQMTITMITCNNQSNCNHYDCYYRSEHTANCTKNYVKAE